MFGKNFLRRFIMMGWWVLVQALPMAGWADSPVKVLFLGDSITAGFGVEPDQAWPALVEKMAKDRGLNHVIFMNGSISGSTSASALSRLKWHQRTAPHILFLALGANDGLRGLSTIKMKENLAKAIAFASGAGMDVLLAGMVVPPNYGPEYAAEFKQVFPELAKTHDLTLIPFLLKDVGGHPQMNQADGIHPNPQGHQVIAKTVFPYIFEKIQKK